MKPLLKLLAAASVVGLGIATTPVSAQQPIRIGVPTAIQLQVGRDTQNAAKLAADEINAKGGVLGRKLEIVVADETENPEQGIAAIKKLTADDKVDVLIGGYTSGVTLAQLPHISQAKTIYIGVGAASPAITAKVKADYGNYKYIFRAFPINAAHQARALVDFINGKLKGDMNITKIAIVGENAKWVQDLVPILKKGAVDGGSEVKLAEFFDTSTSDFSPLFAKVKDSGAQYLIVILSHASSDMFVKQWYDAQVPIPIGGIDVKSQDADFFTRVGGKANSETVGMLAIRAPLTPKTIPFWDEFVKRFGTAPVYTGVRRLRRGPPLCRRGRARQVDRHRRRHQGAGEDRSRRHRRQAGSSTRRTTSRPGRACRTCCSCSGSERRPRRGLAEGSCHGQDDRAALDEQLTVLVSWGGRPDGSRSTEGEALSHRRYDRAACLKS